MNPFLAYDGFAAIDGIPSQLVWETNAPSPDSQMPRATIAIPTYRRFDTLLEAIASAVEQTGVQAPDIVIVDNEGFGAKPEAVRTALTDKGGSWIRYFVNTSNLGMFGNWNRCIELARTDWLTILNDDDLLRPAFLARALATLDRMPPADGLICKKGTRDRRSNPPAPVAAATGLRSRIGRTLHRAAFRGGAMRVDARRLFFGNELGNGAGLLFRRDAALALGGYDADAAPSADFLFLVRLALGKGLYWLDEELAEVGLGDNESMAPEVLRQFVVQLHDLRTHMVGRVVPRSWARMLPLLAANHIAVAKLAWDVTLDPKVIGREIGLMLPDPDLRKERWLRMCNGVF